MIKSKLVIKLGIAILVLSAVVIRFYHLGSMPALHDDELAFGYSAYSIFKTGADEYGRKFPLVLESLGDHKLALNAYLMVPFIAIFGLSGLGLRLLAATLGLFTPVLVYFFTKELFKNKRLAWLSALLILINPAHIVFSRTANEAVGQVFFIIAFWLVWLKYLRLKKNRFLLIGLFFMILGFLSYYSSFLFLPIMALAGLLLVKKQPVKIRLLPFLLLVVLGFFILKTQSLGRIKQTTFLQNEQLKARISQNYLEEGSGRNLLVVRLFNNKYYTGFLSFLENYFYHLSPKFLFLEGSQNYSRYSIPEMGPFYLLNIPFLLIGIYIAAEQVVRKKNYHYGFVLFWFFAAFLASSFSDNDLNVQRSLVVVPSIQILVVLGLINIWQLISNFKFKTIFLTGLIILYVGQISLFANRYFIHSPVRQPWHRRGYLPEMVASLNELTSNYDQAVIAQEPATNLFFYQKTLPVKAQQIMTTATRDQLGFVHLGQMNNYFFMPLDCPGQGKEDTLYVCRGQQIPYNSKIIKVIRYADGLPARIFLEFVDNEDERTKKLPWRLEIIPETRGKFEIIDPDKNIYW